MKNRIFLAIPLFLIALLLTTASSRSVSAQTTPTPTMNSALADAELEREKQITQELSLNMPDQTDDPNYPITFVDPSKQGVDITIDDKTTTKAPSPFLLPNLSIGQHKIIFKFKTKDGVVRVLSKTLLVIPKSPQFDQTVKTQVVRPAQVTITGTALPQSTVMLVINSTTVHKISSNSEGKWEFIVPEPKEGENHLVAFTIRNGIVSAASNSFTVSYSRNATQLTDENETNAPSIESQLLAQVQSILSNIDRNRIENPKLFYGVIGGALIVILLMIDLRLRKRAAKSKEEKTIASLLGNLQEGAGTIVEAIQSTNKPVLAPKNTKTELVSAKKNPQKKAETTKTEESKNTEKEPVPTKGNSHTKPKKPIIRIKKRVIKSKPLTAEVPEELTPDEPEKKVLTKDEFLKQFQQDDEQA